MSRAPLIVDFPNGMNAGEVGAMFASGSREKFVKGGAGSAKSLAALVYVYNLGLAYPNNRIYLGMPVLSEAKRTMITDWYDLIHREHFVDYVELPTFVGRSEKSQTMFNGFAG